MNSEKLIRLLAIKSKCYLVKSIPKRSAGYRKIQIPQGYLKVIQLRILRRILDRVTLPDYFYAFEQGRNVVDKAAKHTGKDYVISFDIKDFFPSIRVSTVKEAIVCQGLPNITEEIAEILAELCTYKFFLPQGAVTSPKISNLVSHNTFGAELHEACEERGLTMTIYADDITLSFNVPEEHASDEVSYVNGIVAMVKEIVTRHGFQIHTRGKLKVMHKDFRQEVCGIVVNEKISLKREQRRHLRAVIHNLTVKKTTPRDSRGNELLPSQIIGKVNWFQNFSPETALAMKEVIKIHMDSQHQTVETGVESSEEVFDAV